MLKRVLILSGEASGDHHAAELVKATFAINPDIYFFGMGGENMRAAGVDIVVDAKDMAVVGAIGRGNANASIPSENASTKC
ncbi:MAG: lpxB [Gammaproteobacteria bacterium]|nr:lpxB [Gammaproteobacteria bacterium]